MKRKKRIGKIISYIVLILVAVVMLYPLVWMVFASLKNNDEIFLASLIPKTWTLDGYVNGWKGSGQYTYATFFKNTFLMVIPMVVFTVISASLVAFGFARFKFWGKKVFFALMMGCMMLPNAVIIIPRYIMFRDMKCADDEKRLLSGLCDFYPWKDLGFQIVARAENGRQVLDYVARNPVDVVFTDISMPVMTGIELAEVLHREYPNIKIVFLSGYSEFQYARQALKYGVHDYILKPVKTDELRKTFVELKRKLDGEDESACKTLGYYENIVKFVETYIVSNLKTANLDEAALTVNLSAGYLSSLYKKETGINFSDYLLKARMEKARELLLCPEYKTYDISENLGYENPKNFSRAFKAYYGISPRDFRMSSEKGKEWEKE